MRAIRHIGLFLFAAAVFGGCGKDDSTIDIPAQRTAFETYLESVTESTELVVDAELVRRHNIYRITPGPGKSDRRVASGDAVTIEYYGCVFDKNSKDLGRGGLFATNDPVAADSVGLTDYPGLVLPPEELTIRQGAGEILRGIDRGLQGAGLRDTILLYLTSDLTYGDKKTGRVPAGTPTVFTVIIHEIK